MQPREKKVDHEAAERYEAGRTLTRKYIKEFVLPSEAWQWAVWFRFNGEQCGTPCPYWPEECYVGSDVCEACEGFEGIQIVTKHTGRVYCKNRRAEVLPLPECYFLPEGKERLETETRLELPTEPCPW